VIYDNDDNNNNNNNSLTPEDREALAQASKKIRTWSSAGVIAGLGLGTFLAFRLRSQRRQMFAAFRASEKPQFVKFADGREEAIPDLTPLLKPSLLGDLVTYFFFGAGGLFIGVQSGVLTGAYMAKRHVAKDPERAKRVKHAFSGFRADLMKKEAEHMQQEAAELEKQ